MTNGTTGGSTSEGTFEGEAMMSVPIIESVTPDENGKFKFEVTVVDNAGNETSDVALLRIIDDIEEELYGDSSQIHRYI